MICPSCLASADDNASGPAPTCPSCGSALYLQGRYRLDSVLASPSQGHRFRGWDVQDDRPLVVKEHPLGLHPDPKRTELALREARVLAELHHPAIPAGIASFIEGAGRGRALWTVQAWIDGVDLRAECAERRYTVAEVLDVLAEILDILAWLHALSPPVFHRDVKPANLIRDPAGRIHLVDFGVVRDALERDGGGSTVAGTFGYMAPEQFAGEVGPGLDIFAAGATAIALLSRKDPASLHDRAGRFDWQAAVVVPPAVKALLTAMVQPDPRVRARDAAALAVVARRLSRGLTPPAAMAPSVRAPFADPHPTMEPERGVTFKDPPKTPIEWLGEAAAELSALPTPAAPPWFLRGRWRWITPTALLTTGLLIIATTLGLVGLGATLLRVASAELLPTPANPPEAPVSAPLPPPAETPQGSLVEPLHCSIQPNTRVDIDPATIVTGNRDLEPLEHPTPQFDSFRAGRPSSFSCEAKVVVGSDGLGQSARIGGETCPQPERIATCVGLRDWRWPPSDDPTHPLGLFTITLNIAYPSAPPTVTPGGRLPE